ncbi:MAG: PLP-dependent decarboxylase [Desulfobacterales bacterium]|nr:PLP-dependent decarboxylase [Desulfobacterales bacterium]
MDADRIFDRANQLIKAYFSEQGSGRFLSYKDPGELEAVLDLEAPGGDWSRVFDWIELYLAYSVKTNHKGFVNRMWAGANLPSVLGEMVAAVSNTSACTYESAPVSTLMEKYMIRQMLDLVGFRNGEGQMTTGSSNANLLAMMAARNERLPEVKTCGLGRQPELVALVSADAHYSMEKAANVLGIGTGNLVKVPVTDRGDMDMAVLESRLGEVLEAGALPFFVGGTAGTTVRGAYDSITGLLRLREKYGFWLHIDAAWGGAVIVSDTLKEVYLRGIADVDSLTWDFHKMLGTSLICNLFLINNRPGILGRTTGSKDDTYLFHGGGTGSPARDLGSVSLQCGRRVDSLKWFLDWKFFGKEEFGRRVEAALELCQYAENRVLASGALELVFPRTSFNICFRYKTSENRSNELNLAIREQLYHEGRSLVGYARDGDRLFLRLLLAGQSLGTRDIDNYFSTLIQTGKSLEGDNYG